MIYIHYGATKYEPEKFKPIKNTPLMSKPVGGLWGFPKDAVRSRKDWCEVNEYNVESLENSFQFTLTENANILYLNSAVDLQGLPVVKHELVPISMWVCLDFEKLAADGMDAIQVNISGDMTANHTEKLYRKLCGWDYDSIVVLNKTVIRIL
jgi:hypothetical protein